MQDDITREVIKALQVELYEGEYGNVIARGTGNLEAYLKIVQGYQHWKSGNKEGDAIAQRLAREAIEMDPNYAPAYGLLSRTLWREVVFRTTKDHQKTLQEALETALKAVELDYSADTLSQLGWVYARFFKQFDKGLEYAEKGLALNSNNSRALTNLGLTLWVLGRCEDAINQIDKALRISPIPSANILMSAAFAYRDCQRYNECIALAQKAVELSPDSIISHSALTSCYALSDRKEEAKNQAKELLRINPNFKARDFSKIYPHTPEAKERAARIKNSLIMAGLPSE